MNKEKINIELIKKNVLNGNIYWTLHCLNRINQRNIKILDVKRAILNGKIIENYYDDYPYPSCLIMGRCLNDKILHIVCGVDNEIVYMITVYNPTDDEWDEGKENRRK